MEDDEIENLIVGLRTLLDDNGFGWAREQAEAALDPGWQRRWLARALLDAAESVTVDLAQAELAMLETLGTDEVDFEPDGSVDVDGAIVVAAERGSASEMIDQPRGALRRKTIQELASKRYAFQMLREQLGSID
ncbi:hypothetical protein [Paracoccus sp. AK26]|uniref:hypothetical protein n=1 Tax=Paracoccus sp. AK26 TaxID=2589076 RepID=UPI001427FF72|nr:hypothetical protein [Paracoccus sp. AK26]QIR84908.1 hypothetical protein FIU66_06605 [Paracoccus sp. AK26]